MMCSWYTCREAMEEQSVSAKTIGGATGQRSGLYAQIDDDVPVSSIKLENLVDGGCGAQERAIFTRRGRCRTKSRG
jgi:hypothetical protein